MMDKNTKGAIVVVVVLVGGYFAYKYFGKPKKDNIKIVADYLDKLFPNSPKHIDWVKTTDKDYIDNWAKAIIENKPTFVCGEFKCNTNGGTKVR